MNIIKRAFSPNHYLVYTDGAIRPDREISGLGAIVKNDRGEVCHWWQKRAGAMTCNQAEYAAVIFALERLHNLHSGEVEVYTDSLLLVDQMRGQAMARAAKLKNAYVRLRALVTLFKRVNFHHIPRERNRLADALASDAADGF